MNGKKFVILFSVIAGICIGLFGGFIYWILSGV
ncbi:hypothetical protein gpAD87_07005 [Paenibacillus sp. AD87]|nr:hypothetical protein gpAD87_07005 [Paenibacillus sp. AD87]